MAYLKVLELIRRAISQPVPRTKSPMCPVCAIFRVESRLRVYSSARGGIRYLICRRCGHRFKSVA
jgi:formate dehydrogenase maturation protein FdhE